eukprot:TRINITY_DN7319_c0_g1_i2.p1 TRINITY_DN7319_c0_g1~~TRINITY_DN7319_c0_g1_i2.p1  ORF type:complete len:387 (+),score=73.70 TRINITY_DN7319_c0_g1_i2:114-1163(+)
MAELGKKEFDIKAASEADNAKDMSASLQSNPLNFAELTDFWCAWELRDRNRKPALLVDDMQIEYAPYLKGILPQVKLLIEAFRNASLPVFWSTWWRFGPDDGFFNSMDRFYGPIGWRTAGNALYNHNVEHGGDVLDELAPVTDEEKRRVMHKSYSLDMFDERPMQWLVPDGQGTLDAELQKLGVDTVVQVGAWTDDCIMSTAFHAFSLQYDVVLVEDGVSTASKQHFNAIEVMRGAVAKVLLAADVADYIKAGLPVTPMPDLGRGKVAGGRAGMQHRQAPALLSLPPRSTAATSTKTPAESGWQAALVDAVKLLNSAVLVLMGPFCFIIGWIARGRLDRIFLASHPFLG